MSDITTKHKEVLQHLQEARKGMKELITFSDDWTAVAEVESYFKHVLRAWKGFGRHQLGVRDR